MDNSMEQFCLGQTLHNVIKNIPGGVLVFFPCYKMIEEVVATWKVCFFYRKYLLNFKDFDIFKNKIE